MVFRTFPRVKKVRSPPRVRTRGCTGTGAHGRRRLMARGLWRTTTMARRASSRRTIGSSTPAGAPGAYAVITWRGDAKTGGAARSRTANKSSTRLPFEEHKVDVPAVQITVELVMDIAEQMVDVPMPQTREFVAVVQITPQGRMQEDFVEVTQFIPHECIVHAVDVFFASDAGTNSGSRKTFRQSGFSSIAEQIVVCQYQRSLKSWR